VALAGAVASATLGLAIAATTPPTSRRLDPVRATPSHGAPALDGADALRVYDEIDRRARGLPHETRAHLARTILEEAARAGLGTELVLSVIHVESSFRHRAASPAGALGLMQLRPSTMDAELARTRVRGADPLDPAANVRAGVRYLGRLVRAFDDVDLALVAYNAGPARLRRHLADGQVPERLLRYAQHVRRGADRRALAARSARAPAARLALAPAHVPRTARAFPAGAAGTLAPVAYTAPEGELVSPRPACRRRSIRWSPRQRTRARLPARAARRRGDGRPAAQVQPRPPEDLPPAA
jgi:hypothetical protein